MYVQIEICILILLTLEYKSKYHQRTRKKTFQLRLISLIFRAQRKRQFFPFLKVWNLSFVLDSFSVTNWQKNAPTSQTKHKHIKLTRLGTKTHLRFEVSKNDQLGPKSSSRLHFYALQTKASRTSPREAEEREEGGHGGSRKRELSE